MKDLMAGIDLHSNNIVVGIVDREGKRLAHQKLPCELKRIGEFLSPFKDRLEKLAVESTYNWYWLVDGLQAQGYPVVLANDVRKFELAFWDKQKGDWLDEWTQTNQLPQMVKFKIQLGGDENEITRIVALPSVAASTGALFAAVEEL